MASDYNLALGTLVGRRLLWRAEDLGMLHKDLWGTRKDRSANDAALMKELTFGLARVTGTALATFDNDAKSCYDRVVMTLALIICRKLGLPSKAAAWIGDTTKRMRNFVKTGHGISDTWFGNNDGSGTVKHGIGQGHRAAPAIWLFVSNFLFHILEKSATGVSFFDPLAKRHHHRAADGYVDDVTGFTNLFQEEMMGQVITPSRLAEAVQADANLWHSLLHFSGGALELQKCFWYALIPDGTGGYLSATQVEAQNGSITVDTRPPSKIELRDPSLPYKTLGCQKCPLGTQTAQTLAIREKASLYARQLRNASLSRLEGRMACEAIILPSLAYPLATAYLSEKEIVSIQRPYMSTMARVCGFNGNTSRAVLFGPRELGGFGLTDLAAAQCWAQLDLMMHHLRGTTKRQHSYEFHSRGYNCLVGLRRLFWRMW